MRRFRPRWFRYLSAVILAGAMFVTPAPAQDDDGRFEEPGIMYREAQKPYIQWIAGSILTLAVLLVAFKNPHRSHLD